MENLEKIFEQFKKEGFAKNQYDFSTSWLGKNKSYLSWLKASGSDPSIEALSYLFFELEGRMQNKDEADGCGYSERELDFMRATMDRVKNGLIQRFSKSNFIARRSSS